MNLPSQTWLRIPLLFMLSAKRYYWRPAGLGAWARAQGCVVAWAPPATACLGQRWQPPFWWLQEAEARDEAFDTQATTKMWALRQLVRYCLEQQEQLIVVSERWVTLGWKLV